MTVIEAFRRLNAIGDMKVVGGTIDYATLEKLYGPPLRAAGYEQATVFGQLAAYDEDRKTAQVALEAVARQTLTATTTIIGELRAELARRDAASFSEDLRGLLEVSSSAPRDGEDVIDQRVEPHPGTDRRVVVAREFARWHDGLGGARALCDREPFLLLVRQELSARTVWDALYEREETTRTTELSQAPITTARLRARADRTARVEALLRELGGRLSATQRELRSAHQSGEWSDLKPLLDLAKVRLFPREDQKNLRNVCTSIIDGLTGPAVWPLIVGVASLVGALLGVPLWLLVAVDLTASGAAIWTTHQANQRRRTLNRAAALDHAMEVASQPQSLLAVLAIEVAGLAVLPVAARALARIGGAVRLTPRRSVPQGTRGSGSGAPSAEIDEVARGTVPPRTADLGDTRSRSRSVKRSAGSEPSPAATSRTLTEPPATAQAKERPATPRRSGGGSAAKRTDRRARTHRPGSETEELGGRRFLDWWPGQTEAEAEIVKRQHELLSTRLEVAELPLEELEKLDLDPLVIRFVRSFKQPEGTLRQCAIVWNEPTTRGLIRAWRRQHAIDPASAATTKAFSAVSRRIRQRIFDWYKRRVFRAIRRDGDLKTKLDELAGIEVRTGSLAQKGRIEVDAKGQALGPNQPGLAPTPGSGSTDGHRLVERPLTTVEAIRQLNLDHRREVQDIVREALESTDPEQIPRILAKVADPENLRPIGWYENQAILSHVKAFDGHKVGERLLDPAKQGDFANSLGDVIPSTDGAGVVNHTHGR